VSEVYLHKIATAVPEHSYSQDFAVGFLKELIGTTEKKRNFLSRVYQNTGIRKRHTVIGDYGRDPNDYQFYPKNRRLRPEPGTRARNDLFIREADRLSLRAAGSLLAGLPGSVRDAVTDLVTVSCTGFSAPGFDLRLVKELGLPPSVNRYHLGFMGCAASFPALKLARDICRSREEARVLLVNVELCSLHFQQKFEPDLIVAGALFADGASAALVSAAERDSSGGKILLHSFHSSYIPESEGEMAWRIGDHGFEMKLSYYVPKFIEMNIKPVMEELFRKNGVRAEDIALWAVHPGGRAILEKLEKTLAVSRDDFRHSYDVLGEYGNMSSATIMFVLKRILAGTERGKIFSCAFGPGLVIETGCLEMIS
jgi:predicted naringenin-chalcone synthase